MRKRTHTQHRREKICAHRIRTRAQERWECVGIIIRVIIIIIIIISVISGFVEEVAAEEAGEREGLCFALIHVSVVRKTEIKIFHYIIITIIITITIIIIYFLPLIMERAVCECSDACEICSLVCCCVYLQCHCVCAIRMRHKFFFATHSLAAAVYCWAAISSSIHTEFLFFCVIGQKRIQRKHTEAQSFACGAWDASEWHIILCISTVLQRVCAFKQTEKTGAAYAVFDALALQMEEIKKKMEKRTRTGAGTAVGTEKRTEQRSRFSTGIGIISISISRNSVIYFNFVIK